MDQFNYNYTPNFSSFWDRQAKWSQETFGPDELRGPLGPLKHLRKEVEEAINAPDDPFEYADLLFLIFDATRRAGFSLRQLYDTCELKLEINKARKWGPVTDSDEPVEHIR